MSESEPIKPDFSPGSNEVIETRTCINWVEKDVFHVYCKKGLVHEYDQALEQIQIMKNLFKDNKVPVIVDIRETEPMPKKCRDLYSSEEGLENTSAFCFIVDSAFTKAIANFFISFQKPLVPFRMFTSVKDAKDWLNEVGS